MNALKITLFGFLGLISGGALGFIGPLLVCFAYDAIMNPAPGSGLMTVGWVFCFFTVPACAIIVCVWSGKFAIKKFKNPEEYNSP